MKNNLQIMFLISLLLFSCKTGTKEEQIEKWKNEILETEKEFNDMAQEKDISEAFIYFAADDAVIMRNNILTIGIESIKESYKNSIKDTNKASLTWKPDFVDVASSGDLGYTYGKYIYTTIDSLGNTNKIEGIFHTVWKRQEDGNWRFVWD